MDEQGSLLIGSQSDRNVPLIETLKARQCNPNLATSEGNL